MHVYFAAEVVDVPVSKWTGGVRDVVLDCPLEFAWELLGLGPLAALVAEQRQI